MAQSTSIKGVRIQTVNLFMLGISLIMFAAVLYTTHLIAEAYNATIKASNNYVEWERGARTIEIASDYLTDQARLFASTKDYQHAKNYFHELHDVRSRENALNILAKHDLHNFDESHDCDLEKAIIMSNNLAEREIYAIRLMAEAIGADIDPLPEEIRAIAISSEDSALEAGGKAARAREMLYGAAYQQAKDKIRITLSKFINETMDNLMANQKEETDYLGTVLQRERIMLFILCFINVLIFAMIIILIVRPLKVYINCIKNDKMLEAVGAYEFKYFALTYNDIFALKEHHDKMLRHKAEHDPLTGLYNRAAYDSLTQMLREKNTSIGLLLVDVDKFKQVNDTYGHKTGDETLCKVANLLSRHFRVNDYCIRLGGDEFVVIFDVAGEGIENTIIEKINNINEQLLNTNDNVPPVSLSVGGAISERGFDDNLYKDADAALYEVKEGGRCGIRFFKGEK